MVQKESVLIVGSGIAGLASACRLASKGWAVSVFEANSFPGGKLSEFRLGDFRFDAGPSLFTMPHFLDQVFTDAGKDPRDYYSYKRKEIVCRYFYEDGTRFTAWSDLDKYVDEASRTFEVQPEKLRAYFAKSKRKYELTSDLFIQRSLHTLSTYLSRETVRGLINAGSLGIFHSLHEENKKHFSDPRLVQLFDRYATYNGSSPYLTPGIMSMIPHLEQGYGTFIPEGGMIRITESLYQLACDLGVEFHFNSRVKEIRVRSNRAEGVLLEDGREFSGSVVSNADVVPTYRKLLPAIKPPEKTLKQERSSSALIFYWGINRSFAELDLHNIFFSADYKNEFDHLFLHHQVSDDPTVYINITSKDVEGDAPAGGENWFVMVNVPGNKGQDWDRIIPQLRSRVVEKLSRHLGVDISAHIVEEEFLDPRRIESRTSSYQGSLYGAASNSRFAAFLRHPNFSSRIRNLYFCGGSAHPGGGIPLCLMSGKITAEFITGKK